MLSKFSCPFLSVKSWWWYKYILKSTLKLDPYVPEDFWQVKLVQEFSEKILILYTGYCFKIKIFSKKYKHCILVTFLK